MKTRDHVLLVAAAAVVLRATHLAAISGTAFADVLVGDAQRYDAWAREIAAAVLLAVHPPAIFATGLLQKSALDLVLLTALLAHLAPDGFAGARRGAFSGGVVLGALCLTRENALMLLPLAALHAARGARGRESAARAALVLAGAAAGRCCGPTRAG